MGSAKWEVRRSSHSALSLNGQKSEIDSQLLSLKSEVGSRKSEDPSRLSNYDFMVNCFLSMGELDMTEVFMKTRLNGKDKNK